MFQGVATTRMVRAASLPVWAVLVVEGFRLLREAGWLDSPVPAECSVQEPAPLCGLCPHVFSYGSEVVQPPFTLFLKLGVLGT